MPVPRRGAFVHQASDIGAPSAENVDFVVIQTHLFLWFTSKRFTSIRLPAAGRSSASAAGCRQTDFAGWRPRPSGMRRSGFEELVYFLIGETRVSPEINARDLPFVSFDNRLQRVLPPIGGVDVAGTQRAAFQIADLVEYEQRMIAGAGVMAVPGTVFLFAMRRAQR